MAQYNIVNGPSKFDLMVSLFVGSSPDRQEVYFSLPDNLKAKVVIDGVERESGNGECWNLWGWWIVFDARKIVKIYYSTKNRSGCLEVLK
jgi:hypothetical protein